MKSSYARLDAMLWVLPATSLILAPLLARRAWQIQYLERSQPDYWSWSQRIHFFYNASLVDLGLLAPLAGLLAMGLHRYFVRTGKVEAPFGVVNWLVAGLALGGPILLVPWFFVITIFVLKWVG